MAAAEKVRDAGYQHWDAITPFPVHGLDGAMGLNPGDNKIRVAVVAWAWGSYLGKDGMERGIRAKFSPCDNSQKLKDLPAGRHPDGR